jgi:hypothetical protein
MLPLRGLELRPLSRTARSQSLYRPHPTPVLEQEDVAEFPHRWADRHLLWAPLCVCVSMRALRLRASPSSLHHRTDVEGSATRSQRD